MTAKAQLGLAAGVAVALAAVLVFDVRRDRGSEAQKKLFAHEPQDATGWRVTCLGETVEARRDLAGEWRLVKPVEALADDDEVASFLNSLSMARKGSRFDLVDSLLPGYGLDPPRVAVTLFWQDDSQNVLWGLGTPVGTGAYCHVPPEPAVWLATGATEAQLCMSLDRAREGDLFTLLSYDVREATLEWPERRLVLRKEGDRWWVQKPRRIRARATAVDDFLRTVCGEQVLRFPSVDGDSLGSTTVAVTLTGGVEPRTEHVAIGREWKGMHVGLRSIDSTVVAVRDGWLDELEIAPEDLRDRRIADISSYTVEEVLCRSATQTVKLVRDTLRTWRMEEPLIATADGRRIGDLLTNLAELEAEFYLLDGKPLSMIGLEPPELTLVIHEEDEPPCSLRVGTTVGDRRYALSAFGEICLVGADAFAGWEAPPDSFRRWQLLEVFPYEVEEISVSQEGERALHLVKQRETWIEKEPETRPWDGEPVSAWLEDGRRIRGTAVLGSEPVAPSLELTFQVWGEKQITLELGTMGDSSWARIPGDEAMLVSHEAHAWATRLLDAR